jgi:hypothetical protein
MGLTKWVRRRPKDLGKFKKFRSVTRTGDKLQTLVAGHSKLKKAFQKVFKKKVLGTIVAGGAAIYGITEVVDYINSNSGCFLKGPGDQICKFKELSCCQQDPIENVGFCSAQPFRPPELLKDACKGFDEEVKNSCCPETCSCEFYDCAYGQTMECQRPTVGEALSHFAGGVFSTLWSGIKEVFPWIRYVLYVVCGLFLLWMTTFVRKVLKRTR